MADLARLAGVSVSTVSRALADSPQIPKETREEILRIAETHGYVANIGARRLRLSRTEVIAVVIPLGHETGQPVSDPFFLELLGHLADEVSARGYDLLLTRVPTPEAGWLSRLLLSGRADGVIVVGQSDQHEALNMAARRAGAGAPPFVVWGAHRDDQLYCTVGVDNVGGAWAATEHVLAQGRRRVAFIGASPVPEFAQRFEGYKRALAAGGVPFDPSLVLATHLLGDQAAESVQALIRGGAKFDAAVCSTDVIAAATARVLKGEGLRVPCDVMITGFDDIALAAASSPPLTTVRQDLSLGARTMVELLFASLAGEAMRPVVMPTPLIVRRSTKG